MFADNVCFYIVMILRPPRSTRTYKLLPDTTLLRSGETEQVAGLLDQRIGGLEARAGNEARTKQLIRRQAGTRCLQPEAGERLEDDVCKELPVVEEQRSEEHTSELQSLMRISYAVFC